jgi:hypothetical protein
MNIKFIFLITLFSIFCLSGSITFIGNIYTFNKIKQWELVNGIIIDSFVSMEIVENIDNGGKQKMYRANIKYEYIVNGKKYYGDSNNNLFKFKRHYGNIEKAQNYLKKNNIGKNIDIIYDRNDPENAIIKNQTHEIKLFINILSLSFLSIGIIGLIMIINRKK